MPVPARPLAERSSSAAFARWLEGLPALVEQVRTEWGLRRDGEPVATPGALALPVRDETDVAATLKLAFADDGGAYEHLALRHWAGRGAVTMLRADPHRRALLLERLGEEDLSAAWDIEACRPVGGLFALLHRPAPPQLRALSDVVRGWRDDLASLPRDAGLPRRLVEQALSIAAGLVEDPATDGTLVHTDLHYGTVRTRPDGEHVATDPRPLSGDPHCEPAPMLWHRWREVGDDAGALRWTMRERLDVLAEVGGLDVDRARAWTVLRLVVRARALADAGEREEVTALVRIIKAVAEP
ncbi:aminoglycoside phosphotransferase family protein [Nocardioidaceae bacterium]|nr:aminoglycoside phosphotransferase family protein [Nocardioidaceae bacterium]